MSDEARSSVVRSERLDLVLLSAEDVLAYDGVERGTDLLANRPFGNPHRFFVDDLGPLRHRIPQVRKDPSVNPWLVRLMIERTANLMIGVINFHDAPGSDGVVEIGYRVAQPHRRRGYAREATIAMFRWARCDPRVRTFRACVSPENLASRNLVEGLGLTVVGMQEDPDDGAEIIYEVDADGFARRFG